MAFKLGDAVVHKSDKKSRKMVVAAQAVAECPPTNTHNERVNTGLVADGSYYCTWISGAKKGGDYFSEEELELQ
jgi:hypothetical protein